MSLAETVATFAVGAITVFSPSLITRIPQAVARSATAWAILVRRADLQGAELQGADYIFLAYLDGAVYNDDTTWPAPDFNPEARGAMPLDDEDDPDSVGPSD
jgi:hypothetical protein